MMKAVKAALDPSDAQDHVRIVCFMTDGYVGNDLEIVGEIQRHPNARVFSFGIGSSVNRFLLDKMAEYGRGEAEYVTLTDDGSAAARRFHERIRNPLFTDISVDWNGLSVSDVYPKRIPDLFSAKPVVLTGRYPVDLPESDARHDVLATLWARTRIDDLMGQDYDGLQHGDTRADVKETITQLGLEYRLMTQFTSFVAVEEMTITDGGQPRRIDVPVELPDGVSRAALPGPEATPGVFYGGVVSNAPTGLYAVPSGVSANVTVRSAVTVTSTAEEIDMSSSTVADKVYTARPEPRSSGGGGGGTKTKNRSRRSRAGTNAGGAAQASVGPSPVAPTEVPRVSPEEQRQQELQTKLHPSVLALVQRLKNKGAQPGADEAKFVRAGKAEIQIWLTDKSPDVLNQLRQLGFEILLDPKMGKVVIGRLPVEQLEALAAIKAVRYVSPQVNGS
jgi:Ca-activated chloride channel family protein